MRCQKRHNAPFEKRFLDLGYNAFYLDYSCGEGVEYPTALNEVVMAITYIRENYKGKLAIIGFSAGGHLIGQTVNGVNDISFLQDQAKDFIVPDYTIYCYPVVSTRADLIHECSFKNLLKDRFVELKESVSLENMITNKSAPAFILHCANDGVVPVGNSLVLAQAYIKNKVPVELHVLPTGGHGLALPTEECYSAEEMVLYKIEPKLIIWFDWCVDWLKRQMGD